MIRVKTLGLALLAALSLCAVGASSASAGYFVVPAGVTSYVGTPGTQGFTLSGERTGSCTGGYLAGTVYNDDKALSPAVSDMNCETSYEGPVSWDMNGCKATFTPGVDGTGAGTFAIGPAGCGPITLTGESCTREIGPQSGRATFENQAGSVSINIAAASLFATVAKEGASCQPEPVSYTGSWTVTPANGTLQAASDRTPVFLGGSGFAAGSYPAALVGIQDAESPNTLTRNTRQYTCSQVESVGLLTNTVSEVALAPKYIGCQAVASGVVMPAEIEAGSCAYTVTSSGTFGVSCAEGGDAIKITLYSNVAKQAAGSPLCVYRIAPQTSGSAIGVSTVGEGASREVALSFSANALVAERTVGTNGICGEKSESFRFGGTTNVAGALG